MSICEAEIDKLQGVIVSLKRENEALKAKGQNRQAEKLSEKCENCLYRIKAKDFLDKERG